MTTVGYRTVYASFTGFASIRAVTADITFIARWCAVVFIASTAFRTVQRFFFYATINTEVIVSTHIAEIIAVTACTTITANADITFWLDTFAAFGAEPTIFFTANCAVVTILVTTSRYFKTCVAVWTMISITTAETCIAVRTHIAALFADTAHRTIVHASLAIATVRTRCHLVNTFFFVTYYAAVASASFT